LGTFRFDLGEKKEVGDGQHWQVYIYFHITGGDGNYTYYQNDELITGPEYILVWGCGFPAVGKFVVVSGDGQRAETPFWIDPVGCTPP
jgi:hypothetical protein